MCFNVSMVDENVPKDELLRIIRNYEERFRMIKGILYYEYGSVSNDDLLGFIDRTLPKDIKPKKL